MSLDHATEMELIERARARAEAVFMRCSPGATTASVPIRVGAPPTMRPKPMDRVRG